MQFILFLFLLLDIFPSLQAPTPQSSTADAGANSTSCSPAVAALASGICANIAVQNNEITAAASLGAMLSESPIDTTLFAAGQAGLLGFVKQGIEIRINNQAIAPKWNAALVGMAQMTGKLFDLTRGSRVC
jgi:hypothetical protein